MCEICRQVPCHPRCPNAPEPEAIHKCGKCGCKIYEGDKLFDGPEGYVCKDCIEGMTVDEFMELIGETFSIAEKEE